MVNKKVLIAGGCGYVGGGLTDCFLKNNYDVVVFDSLMYETRFLKDVELVRGDIRDRGLLSRLLPNFDTVIWLAAVVGDGACAIDPFFTQAVNEDTVRWLTDNFDGQIVFTSTCSVYGINNNRDIDEQASLNPLSVYAKTKLAAEQYLLQHAKIQPLVFRLGTLFGKGDVHSRVRLDLVVNALTKRACRKETLKVSGGAQWRPLLHVKDVATAVEHGLRNGVTGLFNLSCQNYTIRDIAKEIQSTFSQNGGQEVSVEFNDLKYEDLRNYHVSANKWLAHGWTPQYTLVEGILEMKKIFDQHRLKNINDSVYTNEGFIRERQFTW